MAKKVYINIDAVKNDNDAIIKYIASDRSDGKTTHCITLPYDEAKASGKVGVIVRRYVGECSMLTVSDMITCLKTVRETGAITTKGSPKKDGVHFYEDGKEFAVLIPLSRAGKVKGGFDCKTHKNVYVDEYVPLDGRYLANEAEAILEIYRTIDRDSWSNSVYIFANHVTFYNPVFAYFEIMPRDGLSRWRKGRFLLLQVANKGNREAAKKSPLGELVEGTSYENYMQGGTLRAVNTLIEPKHTRERLNFVVRISGRTYGFYIAINGTPHLVIDRADARPAEPVYTTEETGGKDGGVWIKSPRLHELLYSLRIRMHQSLVFAASEMILEEVMPLWTMLIK